MNLGVYIQVPFCQSKCTYCNFHTGVFPESLQHPYVAAVCREITEHAALHAAQNLATPAAAWGLARVDTGYVGGGGPTPLPAASLAQMMDALRGSFACEFEEATLEADPETVTAEEAAAWRAA